MVNNVQITKTNDYLLNAPWRELQRTKAPDNALVVIGMDHFLPMLIILLSGITLTLVTFATEKILRHSCWHNITIVVKP